VLARQFRETDLDKIEFVTVPFMEYEPDRNRLVWAPQADELWARIIADKPLDKKLSGIISADTTPSDGPSDDPSGSPSDGPTASPDDEGTPGGDTDATAAENGLCA
jgi:hypothetical protein